MPIEWPNLGLPIGPDGEPDFEDDTTNHAPVHNYADFQSGIAPATSKSTTTKKSRPGIQEKRIDHEPRVYKELPEFLPFNQPIPAEASIEEICIRYPNHIRGSYLDAFLQYFWTGLDIYSHMSDAVRDAFKTHVIVTDASFNNRANVFGKRLDNRLSKHTEESLAALCNAPKLRGCFMSGGHVKWGKCKMQGKYPNPYATEIKSFPHRQGVPRQPKASIVAAAKQTFVYNATRYQLWALTTDMDKLVKEMAKYWYEQRACAEEIVRVDEEYANVGPEHRKQVILQVTNWPMNSGTMTFFSFHQVEQCSAFIGTINKKMEVAMIQMLNSCAIRTGLNHGATKMTPEQLARGRVSAAKYILSAEAARLDRLNMLIAGLPEEGMLQGVVDHVFRWNEDAPPIVETAVVVGSMDDSMSLCDSSNSTRQFAMKDNNILTGSTIHAPIPNTHGARQAGSKRSREEEGEAIPRPKTAKRVRFDERQNTDAAHTECLSNRDEAGISSAMNVNTGTNVNFSGPGIQFDEVDWQAGNGSNSTIFDMPAVEDFDWSFHGDIAPDVVLQHDMMRPDLHHGETEMTHPGYGSDALLPDPQAPSCMAVTGENVDNINTNVAGSEILTTEPSFEHALDNFDLGAIWTVGGSRARTQTDAVEEAQNDRTTTSNDLPDLPDNDIDWLTDPLDNSFGPDEDWRHPFADPFGADFD